MERIILKVENISKRFGGIIAVNDLSFEIKEEEIIGIMGPNGAGKTTLLNIISGELKPDGGRIIFGGENITGLEPHQVVKKGIGRTYQIPQPFKKLTCIENVAIALMYGCNFSMTRALKEAERILEFVEFPKGKNICAGELDEISLKRLELARALALHPRLLLVDEIAGGLTDSEIPQVLKVLKRINEEFRITILIIEHVIKVLISLVQRIIVLDRGQKIFEGTPEEAISDRRVIEAYFGQH
uniref:ABC transporter ATP-binding protein n=1 Tax=candidate division WOR-3 bacterium TaxID=2052148 RepID=A0A7C2K1P1_UNCW3